MAKKTIILLAILALLPNCYADAQISVNSVTLSGIAEAESFFTIDHPDFMPSESESFFSDASTRRETFVLDASTGLFLNIATAHAESSASIHDDGLSFTMAASALSAGFYRADASALLEVDFQLDYNSRLSTDISSFASEITLLNTDTNIFYDLGTSGTEIIDAGNYLFRNQVIASIPRSSPDFAEVHASNFGSITFTAVPEPSALTLLTVVGTMLLFRRNKIAS